jgi:hypothetical protein
MDVDEEEYISDDDLSKVVFYVPDQLDTLFFVVTYMFDDLFMSNFHVLLILG